jgi:hypothetical protein
MLGVTVEPESLASVVTGIYTDYCDPFTGETQIVG